MWKNPWLWIVGGVATFLVLSSFPSDATAQGWGGSGDDQPGGGVVDPELAAKIYRIIGQWESARDHGALAKGELSYGWWQANWKHSLPRVLEVYISAGGQLAAQLQPWLNRMEARDASIRFDSTLRELLRQAGHDPIMHATQNKVGHEIYFNPIYSHAQSLGWRLPVSYLAVADASIHEGVPATEQRMTAAASMGGEEVTQVNAFLNAHEQALRSKGKEYQRPQTYRRLLTDNPTLVGSIVVRNTPIS